jgi:hypothetical protein
MRKYEKMTRQELLLYIKKLDGYIELLEQGKIDIDSIRKLKEHMKD